MNSNDFFNIIKQYGVGRRSVDDKLFDNDKPLPKYTIYDADDENLCHEIIESTCSIPNCNFKSESLLEFENHYNTSHRYSCVECKKTLPTPHLLDLHVEEKHDSFFAVASIKKAMYCCYIEECSEKFWKADERLDHCVKVHKLPKDFRFEHNVTKSKLTKTQKKKSKFMDVDEPTNSEQTKRTSNENKKQQIFHFTNSKQKAFTKYTGRKFTTEKQKTETDINIDQVMTDLKDNLPTS